jgi:negative regulator of genetic competence, sporulation and motility
MFDMDQKNQEAVAHKQKLEEEVEAKETAQNRVTAKSSANARTWELQYKSLRELLSLSLLLTPMLKNNLP